MRSKRKRRPLRNAVYANSANSSLRRAPMHSIPTFSLARCSARQLRKMQARRRAGARQARASFNAGHAKLHRELIAARRMTRRLTVMRHRLKEVKGGTGHPERQVKRRERTGQHIE